MTNVEGGAAANAASGGNKALADIATGFFGGFAKGKKRASKKAGGSTGGGTKTAADWHNEEIAARYQQGRDQVNWGFNEQSKLNDATIRGSEANAQYTRDQGALDAASRRRRGDVTHVARTGARYGAGTIDSGADGGIKVEGTTKARRLVMPEPTAAPSASKTIQPSKSTIARGRQTGGGKAVGQVNYAPNKKLEEANRKPAFGDSTTTGTTSA